MHPNGQIPAYEWCLGDVNPPVHAWAALRVYRSSGADAVEGDRVFLEKVFHKLLLNFTWWVNRKDAEGKNVFQGGFLGLDNIGVFDRSAPLPTGGRLEQSDGTSWMAMYCLNMLAISLELAKENSAYEDVASKFFEHFVYIAHAMYDLGGEGLQLWDEEDGFFYDVLKADGLHTRLKVRSMVGLIPLFAVETLEPAILDKLPGFRRRLQWFIDNRPALRKHITTMRLPGRRLRRMLSIVGSDQLPRVLRFMLDENEFLVTTRHSLRVPSPSGSPVRAVAEWYGASGRLRASRVVGHPLWRQLELARPGVVPPELSPHRGPAEIPPLLRRHLTVPYPTGSARLLDLWQVATELSQRLTRIFLRDGQGRRPVFGGTERFQRDPHWRDLILFYEYFHGDNGAGIGASHQTGWTGLVAKLLQQSGEGHA